MDTHGGPRVGQPGKNYANRMDMQVGARQAAQAPTGLPYGQHQAMINSQHAVGLPVAQNPAEQLVGLHEPTQRPNEPITAGMATGPGPGPEAVGLPPSTGGPGNNPLADQLRALYLAYPSSDLAGLIEQYDAGLL